VATVRPATQLGRRTAVAAANHQRGLHRCRRGILLNSDGKTEEDAPISIQNKIAF